MCLTSLELQPLAFQPSDLLRPLDAFEELFCLFDQYFPHKRCTAAQIIGHTTVQQWLDALDEVQQRHPLLSARIDTTFKPRPSLSPRHQPAHPLRLVTSPFAQWQQEIAEKVNAPFTPDQAPPSHVDAT